MFNRRTPTIEAYRHNAPMRARYIEINSLKHVEALEDDEGRFYPFMCCGDSIGFPEDGRTFDTEQGVEDWAARYCPELPVFSVDGDA